MIPLILSAALLAQGVSAYDKAVPSTVRLRILDAREHTSVATGVVVGDGRVLTAYHAVKGATRITADAPIRRDGAVVADPKEYGPGIPCTLLDQSPGRDLALLRAAGGRAAAQAGRQIPGPGRGVLDRQRQRNILLR